MPKIHEMLESKFLKKEDVGPGVLLAVEGCVQKNVAQQGADPEMKWCLTFADCDKPLVLNSTNIQLCKIIFESDDTDHWIGKKIVLYTDPNVSYGGKIVGGIRVRKPKGAAASPVTAPVAVAAKDAEIEALKRQLAEAKGFGAEIPPAGAPVTVAHEPLTTEIDADEIPFAWLVPFVLPLVGLIGLGITFA